MQYFDLCRSPLFVNKGIVFCQCGVRINTEVVNSFLVHQLFCMRVVRYISYSFFFSLLCCLSLVSYARLLVQKIIHK